MFHFVCMRIRNTVGADQPVIAEVDITCIETVEITSVCINHFTVLSGPSARLVNKVPNKSTLVFRILAHQIPIFFEAAFRVTHGMRILALNQRFLLAIVFAISNTALVIIIHRAEHIGLSVLPCLFILYRTAGVFSLYPVVCGFKVRSITGFITQRPENNAGMIERTLHIALVTFHVCLGIRFVFRQRLVTVSHTVRLNIRLCYHINSIPVAQFIPESVIWIMAGTYCIDIEFLHAQYVLNHPFA